MTAAPIRPTTLRLAAKHCPHAVDLYERGIPYDRDVFAVGTAAHDVLHAIAEGRSVDEVCAALVAVGRGGVDAEPPLQPDAVLAGRRIAEAWVAARGGPEALRGGIYEVGLGFGRGWVMEPYESATWLRSRIDAIRVEYTEDTDDGGVAVLAVEDYKSSWRAGEDDLDDIQRTIQLLAVHSAMGPILRALGAEGAPIEAIDVVVHNLRTTGSARRRWWLHRDDLLDAERARVAPLVDGLLARPRRPSPGAACIGCPYAGGACGAHRDAVAAGFARLDAAADPEALARAYTAHRARAEDLRESLAAALADAAEPRVVLPDGSAVGHVARTRAVPAAGVEREIWREWRGKSELSDDLVVGLLQRAKLGVTQIRAIAKEVSGSKQARLALESEWLEERPTSAFDYDKPGTHAHNPEKKQ